MSSKRKTHKITFRMLAKHLKVTEATVYQWSSDKRNTMLLKYMDDIEKGIVPDPRLL